MFQFFFCNLTDTCSFVAERIYEYHANIILVALIVMVIVTGGLYFTYIFLVKNIVIIKYNWTIVFMFHTLIALNEKVISSIFERSNKKNFISLFEAKIRFLQDFVIIRNNKLLFKLSWI